MLESFRLCCQWFMTSKDIIEEAKESSNILWTRLVALLNLVTPTNAKYEKDPELQKVKVRGEIVAFPEDKISRGLKIFEDFHKNLDFETVVQLTKNQLGLARLHQMSDLKVWLANLPKSGLKINAENNLLEFSDIFKAKEEITEKAQLMENMAQLWLQQVSRLNLVRL